MRLQLLHFHVVCKTWSIFQQLSSIFSFRKTRWRQLNFSENRNKQCNQGKCMLKNPQGLCRNIFTACRCRRPRRFFLSSLLVFPDKQALHMHKYNELEIYDKNATIVSPNTCGNTAGCSSRNSYINTRKKKHHSWCSAGIINIQSLEKLFSVIRRGIW